MKNRSHGLQKIATKKDVILTKPGKNMLGLKMTSIKKFLTQKPKNIERK
jgi:hypothetical protein